MSDNTTARLVGVLFIVATVAGVVGISMQEPVVDAPDYLSAVSQQDDRVATGALLQLVMGVAVVAIAVALYPVLRRSHPRLALGYVVARTVEGVVYLFGTVGLLTLVSVSRDYLAAGEPSGGPFAGLGALLLAERDWAGHAVLDAAVFGISAVILNYVLWRTRLVPAWLSVSGLIGAALYMLAGVLVMYGLEPLSTTQVLLEVPLGLQEMALAVWLIVKGFREATGAREPSPDMLEARSG